MRKTKIIATLGPATQSPEVIDHLMRGGMNIARLNMSHARHDWVRQTVATLRASAQVHHRHVGILMDTQGPSIRTGDLQIPLNLQPGQRIHLTVRGERSEEVCSVDVNYENFINDIQVGDTVLVDNGAIHLRVLSKLANQVECEVLTPGTLGSRRHINLPGIKVNLPAMTEKDKSDIRLGLELGVDFLALSFVREASDMIDLKQFIGDHPNPPLLVAKIEDAMAVKNFEAIAAESDAIMIARGDLGIECPYEELPIIQRQVVESCLRCGRPVIVATHMLESMIQNPMPTRAEITDVANAVFEQADAIMLSGETSVGKYPIKCVEVFDVIARRIERGDNQGFLQTAILSGPREKLVKSAVVLAEDLQAAAIIVFTVGGHMARRTSWLRPRHAQIYAMCTRPEIARSLSLNWGVKAFHLPRAEGGAEQSIYQAINLLKDRQLLASGQTVVVLASLDAWKQIADSVQMQRVP